MQIFLPIACLCTMLLMTVLPGQAQVQRISIYDPNVPGKTEYLDVYEFDYVDVQPEFPGGERGLINFVNQTREYPYAAYHNGVQGRVLCQFVVCADGKVKYPQIIRGSHDESLNREALRVISKMPKWHPGREGKMKVAVRVVLPIAFRL